MQRTVFVALAVLALAGLSVSGLPAQSMFGVRSKNLASHVTGKDQSNVPPEYPTANDPVAVVVGDFNKDGNADLAVSADDCNPTKCGNSPVVSILLGNGDGTFQPHVDYPVEDSAGNIVTADFNGDGNLDLALVTLDGQAISILFGNGDGTFQPAISISVSYGLLASLAVGDFNGDQKPDIALTYYCVAAYCSNTVYPSAVGILLGNGNGTFQPEVDYNSANSPLGAIVVGDFNNDGFQDLALGSFDVSPNGFYGGVSIMLGNGDGTFQAGQNTSLSMATGSVAVGQLTHTNDLDLLAAGQSLSNVPSLSVMLGNGNGTFQAPVGYPSAIASSVTTADFNGDGNLDVATTGQNFADPPNYPSFVTTLLGNGDGTLQTAVVYPTGSGANEIATGDFNNDGKPDLVTTDSADNAVSILLNQGNGFFAPPNFTLASNPASLTAVAGQTVQATITISPEYGSFNQPVNLSCSGPDGSTCTVNPASVTPGGNPVTATVTEKTTSETTPGAQMILVTGSSANGVSNSVTIPFQVQSFEVAGDPSTLTVSAPGGNAQAAVTVTPEDGFNQAVTFSCSGLPAETTCAFDPLMVTPNGNPVTSTLTIQTTAASGIFSGPPSKPSSPLPMRIVLMGLGGILAMALIGWRLEPSSKLRWATCSGVLLLTAIGMASCGGSSSGGEGGGGNSGTPAGTYTITVKAATSGAGAVTQTTSITLTVN